MNEISGPPLESHEELYRAITYAYWWLAEARRPTSAAFDHPLFSVDVASRTTPLETLGRFRAGTGLVAFSCGVARQLGFDARDERDPAFPENAAHAHVYFTGSRSQRKKRARKLADACAIVVEPTAW